MISNQRFATLDNNMGLFLGKMEENAFSAVL